MSSLHFAIPFSARRHVSVTCMRYVHAACHLRVVCIELPGFTNSFASENIVQTECAIQFFEVRFQFLVFTSSYICLLRHTYQPVNGFLSSSVSLATSRMS